MIEAILDALEADNYRYRIFITDSAHKVYVAVLSNIAGSMAIDSIIDDAHPSLLKKGGIPPYTVSIIEGKFKLDE